MIRCAYFPGTLPQAILCPVLHQSGELILTAACQSLRLVSMTKPPRDHRADYVMPDQGNERLRALMEQVDPERFRRWDVCRAMLIWGPDDFCFIDFANLVDAIDTTHQLWHTTHLREVWVIGECGSLHRTIHHHRFRRHTRDKGR